MSVVVLGWDALDRQHIERFGLGESFGSHRATIDTYVNPTIGEPHTAELWPSMITGLHPDEHGVHAVDPGGGVNWESDLLRAGSDLADRALPDALQSWLGKRLREHGADINSEQASYYADLPTVFDDGGRAISVPNYETPADRRAGLDAHRNELWRHLNVDKSPEAGMAPGVQRDELYQALGSEVGKRLGQTLQAVHAGEGLVWCWFGLLDTVGHMQPALGDELVAEWYDVAADVTELVRSVTPDETTVLAVSDHGIQGGEHTHYATVASDDPAPVDEIEHVFDVAGWVRSAKGDGGGERAAVEAADVAAVEQELEALGYISG